MGGLPSSPLKLFDQREDTTVVTLARSLKETHLIQDQSVSVKENRFILVKPPSQLDDADENSFRMK